jgi:anti-sigma B factor antagonist
LKLKSEEVGAGVFVISLEGELDIYSTASLESKIKEVQDKAEELVLDLSRLDFMDGAGLRAIIEADQRARAIGSSLKIVEGSSPVHKVFCLTGFDQRLNFVPTTTFDRRLRDL